MKKRLARTPLWLRLVVGTLAMVTLAIALTGGFAVQLLRGYLTERVDEQLAAASRPLRDMIDVPISELRFRDGVPRPQRFPGLFHVSILDARGDLVRTVAESPGAEKPALPRLTADEVRQRLGKAFTVPSVNSPDPPWRVVAVPGRDSQSRVVAMSMGDLERTVSRLTAIVAGAGGAVLVALGLACYWLVRRSLRPLGEVERTAAAIAAGDLSQRVPMRHRRTEMGRLGRAINGMLTQIEAAFQDREASEAAANRSAYEAKRSEERMRRFVADASHELRTPLTSIRGFAELYRQEHGRNPGDDLAGLVRRIEDEAARMGLLVDDLLLLARLDQQRPFEREPVDVLSLAAGAVLDAQLLAPDREIELHRLDDSDEPVTVGGDEARLRQVIGNLVGNALRHTPAGTPFRVGVGILPTGQALTARVGGENGALGRKATTPRPDGGPGAASRQAAADSAERRAGVAGREAVIEVADEGPGVPDPERVFERFYRGDPSRTRDSGGTGLGLSIAAALVHAHGGTITAENTAPGARFRIRLPMSS
ncbi:two-component sensor histidine kinase [Acrocarpospora phusangensis]|uniref:histidine kinase n=1 Tax=Acrocarpospora phusangensis TaxID=1070424 RepID=A0A919QH84_9ACTN|nr:HAMP domain-containing sensor histidine kinase [Acrocarpospora phusangensis]GIH28751.1 two-component sensor histidine kinase [Acrocarpospora phusangensis]